MRKKLSRELSALVNRKTHAWSVIYAKQSKQQLLTELEIMLANGATLADIERYLGNRPPPILTTFDSGDRA